MFSAYARPTNWIPVGRSARVNPLGTEIAGNPTALPSAPSVSLAFPLMAPLNSSSIGDAGFPRVGPHMASYFESIGSTICAISSLNRMDFK